MKRASQFASPLETALAKIKKKEEGLWGKTQSWSHQWLARLEGTTFLQKYRSLVKKPHSVPSLRSEPAIDLDSLLLLSLLFHILFFFLLTRINFSPAPLDKPEPILVHIFDLGRPSQEGMERSPKRQEKTARPQPRPSGPSATEEQKSTTPSPTPAPLLPGPKVLAEIPREKATGLTGESVEALIQLPTRQSGGGQASLATKIDPLPANLAGEGVSVPEKLRGGEGAQRTGPAGSGGLAALSSPDFAPYLEMIKKRVQSVWKYPEGISGKHQVNLLFVLDRGGNLVRVEVLDSTDSKLDSGALQAMKQASPFPPVPQSLRELAGWPLRIRFNIDFGVKVAR